MAGQRHPEKRHVGVWLDKRERETLKRIADQRGVTISDLFRQIILEAERAENAKARKGND